MTGREEALGSAPVDRARGLMLGLLLGDAHEQLSGQGVIRPTCVSQLALFTLEGLIRACVRMDNKGICTPSAVVWHAWCRWAHIQGIEGRFAQQWGFSGRWPNGWLHELAPLAERRGNAPATVAALRTGPAFPQSPRTASDGYQAVTRSLPVAIGVGAHVAVDIAALTHGAKTAQRAAGLAASAATGLTHDDDSGLREACKLGAAAKGSATQALRQGAQAVTGAPNLATAVSRAAPHGRGATTVAGALFGASHGVDGIPGDLLQRLELGWAADQLARDAVTEFTGHPAGGEDEPTTDPAWWSRYPGW